MRAVVTLYVRVEAVIQWESKRTVEEKLNKKKKSMRSVTSNHAYVYNVCANPGREYWIRSFALLRPISSYILTLGGEYHIPEYIKYTPENEGGLAKHAHCRTRCTGEDDEEK